MALLRALLAFLVALLNARPQTRTEPPAPSSTPEPAVEPAPQPRPAPSPPAPRSRSAAAQFLDTLVAENPSQISEAGIARIARENGIDEKGLIAVVQVESAGRGFDRPTARPIIRYERHHFSRHSARRFDHSHPHLSRPSYQRGDDGGGRTQNERWAILYEAAELDLDAALKACSWGMGQIMGWNHGVCGFGDVRAFAQEMARSESDQVRAMTGFIKGNEIDDDINAQRWETVARMYNGSANVPVYSRLLREAYERLT